MSTAESVTRAGGRVAIPTLLRMGDRDALAEACERTVRRAARRYFLNYQDDDDVLAIAWLAAARAIDAYRGGPDRDQFLAYIYGRVGDALQKAIRDEHAARRRPAEWPRSLDEHLRATDDSPEETTLGDVVAAPLPTHEVAAQRAEVIDLLARVAVLPDAQRAAAVVLLRGEPYASHAQATAGSRARKALRGAPRRRVRRAAVAAVAAPRDESRCRNGHAWTPENTQVSAAGVRKCRACARDQKRRSRAHAAQTRRAA